MCFPRTNNGAESWNRTLNLRTHIPRLDIANFLEEILKEEELDKFILQRAFKGLLNLNVDFEKEYKLRV